jgi:uncharacterized membrane protein
MAVAFPEAEFEALIYMMLGAFIALTAAAGFYIWKLQKVLQEQGENSADEEDLETDKMGLTKKAEDVINGILEEPMLQSELPDELNVSKATVSNAVSELFERNLVIKKKKANTYLIEPNREEIKNQQR